MNGANHQRSYYNGPCLISDNWTRSCFQSYGLHQMLRYDHGDPCCLDLDHPFHRHSDFLLFYPVPDNYCSSAFVLPPSFFSFVLSIPFCYNCHLRRLFGRWLRSFFLHFLFSAFYQPFFAVLLLWFDGAVFSLFCCEGVFVFGQTIWNWVIFMVGEMDLPLGLWQQQGQSNAPGHRRFQRLSYRPREQGMSLELT